MTIVGARASSNGVIRIERRGMIKAILGDGDVVELDAIAVYDQWWEIDRAFRDENGEVAPELLKERSQAMWNFVKGVFNYEEKDGQPRLTMTEVLDFMKQLAAQVERLRGFFDDSTSVEESSPAS